MSLHITDKNNFIVDKECERNPLWHEGLNIYVKETKKTYVIRNRGFVLINEKGDKGDSIKGDKGDKGNTGDKGKDGYTPKKNIDYFDGVTTIVYTATTATG